MCKTNFSLVVAKKTSIPNQGIEGAAGNPQVIGGQHSFAGKVQQAKSVAGSAWNKGGRGNPPPFQGYVPSHVSVAKHATAATSFVATSGYFVGAIRRSVAEINAHQVIYPKSTRGVLGSLD